MKLIKRIHEERKSALHRFMICQDKSTMDLIMVLNSYALLIK